MKNSLLVLLFFLVSLSSKPQQPFCPPGAVWHYDYSAFTNGGFIRIEYAGDTVINTITCKKLQPVQYIFYCLPCSPDTLYWNPEYIYQNGDTVFRYFNNRFFILFNFGAQPNDEWVISDSLLPVSGCDSTSRLHVDSVGIANIQGFNLRWISVHPTSTSSLGIWGRIYERIGSAEYLFPYWNNCDTSIIVDGPLFWFHCYRDDSFPQYNPQSQDCEYMLHIGVDESGTIPKFKIYPNPTKSYFTIKNVSSNKKTFIEIISVFGEIIYSVNLIDEYEYVVDANLEKGIYFVRVSSEERNIVQKLIVE